MRYVPGDSVDKYVIEGLLGEGGMAVVYKVRHNLLNSLFALKIVKAQHPSIQERLLQEGRVQANLHHPHIVSVVDVLELEEGMGLVMEFVDGPKSG